MFDTGRTRWRWYTNYGERYWQGEKISTAFVQSTVNRVLSKRFVKKQPMQWTPPWRALDPLARESTVEN
jgi:hypothetical protein